MFYPPALPASKVHRFSIGPIGASRLQPKPANVGAHGGSAHGPHRFPWIHSPWTKRSSVGLLASASATEFAAAGDGQYRLENVGTCSIAGSDPDRPAKVNQDAHFVVNFDGGYAAAGVMDGHGLKGHILTNYLATELPNWISEQLTYPRYANKEDDMLREFEGKLATLANFQFDMDQAPVHMALIRAFHRAHVEAMANPQVPAGATAGTTCIVCLVDAEDIHVAYVGDSRAILVTMNGDDDDDGNKGGVHPITESTTVQMPSERQRIQQGEGSIFNGNVFYGPVGVAMTRALGDGVMLRAGVVPTPLVKTFKRPRFPAKLVLATDGVWDVLSNEEAAQIVGRIDSAHEAAEELARAAELKWIGDGWLKDESKVDDITCIVLDV